MVGLRPVEGAVAGEVVADPGLLAEADGRAGVDGEAERGGAAGFDPQIASEAASVEQPGTTLPRP